MRSNLINYAILVVGLLGLFGLMLHFATASTPNGVSVNASAPERSNNNATSPGSADAYAGNITELVIEGTSITQAWQGYYGNVTGRIELADASGNVFYNWTGLSNPSAGEVYASTNQSVSWTNIQCLNFSANGTEGGIGGETAGATNNGGVNVTGLEARYNIGSTDADGVNETFSDSNSHAAFTTASLAFGVGECASADVFTDAGEVDGQFEEVLLYEPETASVVFAGLLEDDVTGFNSKTNDFEILVLEDGHSADTTATTYYFFTELS